MQVEHCSRFIYFNFYGYRIREIDDLIKYFSTLIKKNHRQLIFIYTLQVR